MTLLQHTSVGKIKETEGRSEGPSLTASCNQNYGYIDDEASMNAVNNEKYNVNHINLAIKNEFNASSFDPSVIDARLNKMPYLTIRKRGQAMDQFPEAEPHFVKTIPKTTSLFNLSSCNYVDADFKKFSADDVISYHGINKLNNGVEVFKTEDDTKLSHKKIIKNKNLKILEKFSPFFRKRSERGVNIYEINTRKNSDRKNKIDLSHIDAQLKKVFSHRGMYYFDKNSAKVLFYPPEVFTRQTPTSFRTRLNSYESNLSRSSVETDSEDIKHISDVAL